MELHFNGYEFGEPKYDQLECRARDLTYSRPLYVEVELRHPRDRRAHRAARLHGRLSQHDRAWHVHHQRRRARRRQPARAQPRRLLHQHRGRQHRPPAVQRQGHPQSRRLAGVRDLGQERALRQGRPQAQARGHQAAARRGLREQRRDRRPLQAGRHRRDQLRQRDARQGHHDHAHGSAHRGLQEAAPRRSAHRRQRREARREPVLQLPPLRPRPSRALQVQQEARSGRRPHGHQAARGRAHHHQGRHRCHRRPPHRARQRPRQRR